jgi:eukaryotic-like serine/threonine-protein kinase
VGFWSNLFKSRPKDTVKPINIQDRFDLENPIGQGSMSKVYRARDKMLGRTICLKVLDKQKTQRFEERFKGLKRPNEGVVSVSLRHKNIVRTYEWGLTNKGEVWLAMEMIEGVGLNFLIETRNKQLEGNRFNYLSQIAEGLQYIHDQNYMHRDICPRNTMINTEGVVKLIDFGLTIPSTAEFRRPGNRTGSANYMAPELIKRVSTDHRVDLFALGVTSYETFTQSLPWEGAQSLQTMLSHLNAPGRDPRDFNPDLSPELVKFLMKSIERDPRDRFQSAKEFREACRRLAEKYPL